MFPYKGKKHTNAGGHQIMNNVTSLDNIRRKRDTNRKISKLEQDVAQAIVNPRYLQDDIVSEHTRLLDELDALADEMLTRKLNLIHAKEAAMRAWELEEAQMVAEMESAAYRALRAGVPEEAIYDLDHEPLSDALNSAIRKVQATA